MTDQAKRLREIAHAKKAASPEADAPVSVLKRKKTGTGECRSIALTSGKGGVGKSNTTISLACALTMLNKKVLVLDGDLGLANIHILMGIAPQYNLSHFFRQECSLDQTICTGPFGISIIPGASGIVSMTNPESGRLEHLGRELSALENRYDFLLIDGGAGIGHASLDLCIMADATLLLLGPEPTSLADAYAVAKLLLKRGVESINVLVNMAASNRDGEEIFQKIEGLVKKFLKKELTLAGIIPYDKNVSNYIRMQKNIFIEKQSSDFSRSINAVARKMAGVQPVKRGGFFAALLAATRSKGTVE